VRGHLNDLQTDFTLSGLDVMGGSTCAAFQSISNDVSVEISTLNKGDAIGSDTAHVKIGVNADGTIESGQFAFSVTHLGATLQTSCLNWDAESLVVQNSLENLSNIDKVQVERRGIGTLSNDEGAIKDQIESTAFVMGQTSNTVLLPSDSILTMSDILFVGDRLQFEGQSDTKKFYVVLTVDNERATLNDTLESGLDHFLKL